MRITNTVMCRCFLFVYIFRPLGAAAEPAQPGAAQVPPLGAEQEPDSHREQQGATGGDHQVRPCV